MKLETLQKRLKGAEDSYNKKVETVRNKNDRLEKLKNTIVGEVGYLPSNYIEARNNNASNKVIDVCLKIETLCEEIESGKKQ